MLNFGLSAPIDIQIQDRDFTRSYALAQQLLRGAAEDPRRSSTPTSRRSSTTRRCRWTSTGCAPRGSASPSATSSNNLLVSLSSSSLVAPNYFLNPANNVNYFVAVRLPMAKVGSVNDMMDTAGQPALRADRRRRPTRSWRRCRTRRCRGCRDVATVRPRTSLESISHYAVQRVVDVAANVDGRDLGARHPRHPGGDRRDRQGPADRHAYRHPRPAAGDADRVRQPRARADHRGGAGLCAAGGAVPVLGRSVHHHDGGARGADRHHLDAGAHPHHHQRREPDGHHHDGRHLGVELDPGGELRQRRAGARQRASRRWRRRSRRAGRGCGRS